MTNNVPDLNDIAENLAELLTNSVNVVDQYYNMFFNETPMLIELQQYNTEGELITHYIPNLAKVRADLPNEFANIDLSNLTEEGTKKVIPSVTNQEGKFLTNNGIAPEWSDDVANKDLSNLTNAGNSKLIPDMTGMNGKLLTTDGTEASWSTYNMPKRLSDLINDVGYVTITTRSLENYTLTEDLDNYFEDKINQSKGQLVGNVSTVPYILKNIKGYSHNNYDADKFTSYIGGTPTISDNGIMGNLVSGNKVRISNLQIANANKVRFEFEYTWNGTVPSNRGYVVKISNEASTNSVEAYITTTAGQLIFSATYGGSTQDNFMTCQLVSGVSNRFIIEITSTNTSISWYKEEALQNTITRPTALVFSNDYYLAIGNISGQTLPDSTSDLKRIRVIADDEDIFNGNKTGIDIIKADDFTDSGNIVRADGIASGFSSTNAITKTLLINPQNSLKIKLKVNTREVNIIQRICFLSYNSNVDISFLIMNDNRLRFRVIGTTGTLSNYINISANTTYYIELEMVSNIWKGRISTDDITWQEVEIGTMPMYTGDYAIKLGSILNNDTSVFLGSIDLNAFKIYVDGKLIYQPCLRIPYILSKTGSKVVDAFYRDRVEDMYNQKGYAPYYTFSESNFTLPMGEVYGMTNGFLTTELPNAITQAMTTLLGSLYPIGSLYLGTQTTCPLATLIPGSVWTKVEGRYLCATGQIPGTSETVYANDTLSAGLPQHTHTYSGTTSDQNQSHTHVYNKNTNWGRYFSAPTTSTQYGSTGSADAISGNASQGHTHTFSGTTSNATGTALGLSNTVRPETYGVNVWRRIS